MPWEFLRNRVWGDVGDQERALDWDIMEFAQSLLPYFSQYLVSLPLFSHLLEECNLLCLHTSPLMQNKIKYQNS
jgi:hypothetical protein